MSLSVLLLKMLHYKQTNSRNKNSKEASTGAGNSHEQKITIKIEEHDDNICRVCLKDGGIPIFGSDTLEDISDSLTTIAGIEVRIDDPYPKFLCQPCNELLQGAILFRKTAQQSDDFLKQPAEDLLATDNDTLDYPETTHEDDDNTLKPEETKVKKRRSNHCKKCQISFETSKEYKEHKLTEGHENMKLVCPICKNSYAPLYFKRHLTLHKEEAPYMCDICGKNFIMQAPFSRHRQTHFYELPFKCTLCPYKGRFRESLKMHMRSHTGEKPYQCTQCPSKFINKSNLNKHALTHKGEHDFKCDTCGRGFYIKRELEMHYKVDHTGIKDHVCNICGKAFGYRKQMMKHQRQVHKRAKLRSGKMPVYLKVETMKQEGQDASLKAEK